MVFLGRCFAALVSLILPLVLPGCGTILSIPTVGVSPATVTSGTWVTVSYSGVPQAELLRESTELICQQDLFCTSEDLSLWVGVFAKGSDRTAIGPQDWAYASPPWLTTAPIRWKPLTSSEGETSFLMESARVAELEFVLFSNGTDWPRELAVSNQLIFTDANLPQHVRLARTKSQSEMRVSWSSAFSSSSAYDLGMVRWGNSSGTYENVSSTSDTYVREDLCGPPATTHGWWPAPFFHTAVIGPFPTALNSRVYYVVGSDLHGWSEEYSFEAPTVPSASAYLRVMALADLGKSYEDGSQYHWVEPFAVNTTKFALNRWGGGNSDVPEVQLTLHVGDLAYATGYETTWDRFMGQIEPLAARSPYMTAQGNHERDWPGSGSFFGGKDSGGECGIPTQKRFIMPTPKSGPQAADDGWYSFDQGPAHFVMLNAEMTMANNSEQYKWLEADLAEVDREVTPWIIVSGHRPMYSSSNALLNQHNGFDLPNGPWWPEVEELFYEYQVDLCLWGHVHNAEWTCPLKNGTCMQPTEDGGYDAPVHAVIGNNGGCLLSSWCTSADCCCQGDGPSTPELPNCQAACDLLPEWTKWRLDEFGFSTIEIDGAKTLTVKFFVDCVGQRDGWSMRDCTASNSLAKTFTIERSPTLRSHAGVAEIATFV